MGAYVSKGKHESECFKQKIGESGGSGSGQSIDEIRGEKLL